MGQIMSQDQWKILCLIEDQWMRKEKFPAVNWLATKTGIDQVKVVECLSNPLLQQSLEARGIPMFSDLEETLKPQQIAIINLLLNPADRRSQTAKLQALGINPSTFYGWKRQKVFQEALRTQGERLFGDTQAEVHLALTKQAIAGDMNAIKYYNEMSGRYNPRQTDEKLNVQMVILRLYETIQKHIQDPDVLTAIANDFSEVFASNKPKELE